jgi:hypothetical protein
MGRPRLHPSPHEDAEAIVAIVRQAEPGMAVAEIRAIVAESCGYAITCRRIAQALEADPRLLTSGSAEGPVAVDKLIHALIAAGAEHMVAPKCPQCRRNRASLSTPRLGGRLCGACRDTSRSADQSCAVCGSQVISGGRNREGEPVCRRCRPGAEEDPVGRLVKQVMPLTSNLGDSELRAAIGALRMRPHTLLKLSWEIEDRPALLTGEGAHGTWQLNRLLAELARQGVSGIVVPACPW